LKPVKAASFGMKLVLPKPDAAKSVAVPHKPNYEWLQKSARLASGKELLDR
jgi:hypothetical protein